MMTDPLRPRFAVCLRNDGYPASLEVRKLYQVIDDPVAEQVGHVRVVDESGEDYLYPRSFFTDIDLPPSVVALLREGERTQDVEGE